MNLYYCGFEPKSDLAPFPVIEDISELKKLIDKLWNPINNLVNLIPAAKIVTCPIGKKIPWCRAPIIT